MKVRREVLKARAIVLLAGTMAVVVGSATIGRAADVSPFVKAEPLEPGWYFHGGLDVGGRGYIERPGSGFGYNANGNFLLPTQTDSKAKYEKYGSVPPGAFLDWIYLDLGSKDGRYRFNFLGKDVGYNAQSYDFDFSEAGRHYLSLGWDQTPHLYSTSAKSLFTGVGTTDLTVSNTVQSQLQPLIAAAPNLAQRQQINTIINNNATQIDEIQTQRDKFSAAYRFTPTPDWDFNVSYSHEDRTGTKPGNLNYSPTPAFPSSVIGVPIPVDDTTQIPKASGEYAGTGPWGRYNVKVGYAGSIYTDHLTQLNAENPFGQTGGMVNFGPGTLRLPLPPSNQANAFSAAGATDLPFLKSRFATNNQYSRYTQNDAFIDSSNNGLIAAPLPASSLNGEVANFLTNNVLTSSLTQTLNNKVRVRYYERDNKTSELALGTVVLADSELQVRDADELLAPDHTSYKKTNVNEELTWNPWRWLTLGAGYEFERWDRSDNRFATQTNENVGNVFGKVNLTNWAQLRFSYSYGARRYNSYEIDDTSWLNARMFDLANRNQQKARALLDISITDAITLTPNATLRWDDYPDTISNQLSVHSDHAWNAGVDVGWVMSPTLRLGAGYNYENEKIGMSAAVPNSATPSGNPICNNTATGTTSIPPLCTWSDGLTQNFHSVVASAEWKAIPSKLDFRLNFIGSWEAESHDFVPCPGNFPNCNGVAITGSTPAAEGLPWPNNTVSYQRLDATARYYFDQNLFQQMGFKGQVIGKLRYTVERNSGSFWQADAVNAYFGTLTGNTELTGASRSTFLAYNNPNYTAQLLAASITLKW